MTATISHDEAELKARQREQAARRGSSAGCDLGMVEFAARASTTRSRSRIIPSSRSEWTAKRSVLRKC